jgi:glycosyltransferase involved in cell wall biosynthesis
MSPTDQNEPKRSWPNPSRPGQSRQGQSQPGPSQPGPSQPGQSQPGQSKPGQSKPGQSKHGQSKPGQSKHGVILDLVAAQSPSYKGRGIARYSTELARSIVQRYPEMVNSIVIHPELGPPEGTEDLGEWLTAAPDWSAASVVHLSSVFEPEVPVRTYWPREVLSNRLLTAVTLYDLIPDVFPGWYLEDPGLRRRWRCCREVVRAADAVFTLSESAKADTVGLLGVPERRVSVIGSGTAPEFRRPESRAEAFKVAKQGVRGLRKGFIVYNGAFNPRKNVDNLVQAYASLPKDLIRRHQLVIVCDAPPLTRNHYLVMAQQLGVENRLLIPGFVPEEVLVSLYQSAQLSVFPSLYEGYGLPVVESMACGAPTIAGDNSSLREILPRDARFQPSDPGAISEAVTRGLLDKSFRARLSALASQPAPTWESVADKAANVFEELLRRASTYRPGWRRRPCLALVGVPSQLAEALAAGTLSDAFERPAEGDDGEQGTGAAAPGRSPRAAPDADNAQRPFPYTALTRLDRWRGGYDAVVTWISGAEAHDMDFMERLASEWRGRAVALLDQERVGSEEAALSEFESPGIKVLLAGGSKAWDETAREIVEEAGRPLTWLRRAT